MVDGSPLSEARWSNTTATATARGNFLERPQRSRTDEFKRPRVVLVGSRISRVQRERSTIDPGRPQVFRRDGRLMAIAFVAALFAATISSVAGEVIFNRYKSDLFPPTKPFAPSPEDMGRLRGARFYTAVLTFMTTGGLLGLAMGLAGGLARRSSSATPRAAILGLVLGTATAGGIASVLVPIFLEAVRPTIGLARLTVTHPGRDLGEPRGRRRVGLRGGFGRTESLDPNFGGRVGRCSRGGDCLRDRRGARLPVRPYGLPHISLDHDTRDGPIPGCDLLGDRGGRRLESIPPERDIPVSALLSCERPGSGRIRRGSPTYTVGSDHHRRFDR